MPPMVGIHQHASHGGYTPGLTSRVCVYTRVNLSGVYVSGCTSRMCIAQGVPLGCTSRGVSLRRCISRGVSLRRCTSQVCTMVGISQVCTMVGIPRVLNLPLRCTQECKPPSKVYPRVYILLLGYPQDEHSP